MSDHIGGGRTLLERLIRERRQTLEEFVDFAEVFARENGEVGTLSLRHLRRLVSGNRGDGRPLGRVTMATARLLERIFEVPVSDLLAPPACATDEDLCRQFDVAGRIDESIIAIFRRQLDTLRRLDRQMGAPLAYEEVVAKIAQIRWLLSRSLSSTIRTELSIILAELCALAGWQALDMGRLAEAWEHHANGRSVAVEDGLDSFEAHTAGEQAFVLLDLGRTADALAALSSAIHTGVRSAPHLRAWLLGAIGEAHAADGHRTASLRAFDAASALLPADSDTSAGPYVALDDAHLTRWRGHALARLGDPEAVAVLSDALNRHDMSFARAETGLRVDLAAALTSAGRHDEARPHLARAGGLARTIGSVRQTRRITAIRLGG